MAGIHYAIHDDPLLRLQILCIDINNTEICIPRLMFPPPLPIICEWSVCDTSILSVTLLDYKEKTSKSKNDQQTCALLCTEIQCKSPELF